MAMASNLYNEGVVGGVTGPSAGPNAATAAMIRGSPLRASENTDGGPQSDHQAATAINNRIL